jgi:hypothetical protein
LHLGALSALALAQPLFDLLSRTAEFFAVRGSTGREIVVFALVLVLAPPLVLLALEALAGLADRRLLAGLHLVLVAALVALLAVQVLKRGTELPVAPLLAAASALGVLAAYGYARARAARAFLTVLAPVPVVFLLLFLFASPVGKLVRPAEARVASAAVRGDTPVVLIVFDEFPLVSLLDERGRLDAERYPGFAALARASTWFRTATTVHEGTTHAVPAILTGKYARADELPIFADHPQNVFTLLGRRYRLNVRESQTHLCPEELCGNEQQEEPFGERMRSLFADVGVVYLHMVAPDEYENRLPSVTETWGDFAAGEGEGGGPGEPAEEGSRIAAFERFVASVRPSRRPTFHFLHSMLPHHPWVFSPSCRRTPLLQRSPGLQPVGATWRRDALLVEQAYQRHLVQVACVDRLVGRLLRRLRRTGLWERSLLVVTSDHGVSIRPGAMRREVDPARPNNLQDIALVPLFVKLPGQTEGTVVDAHVQTIDILPTIADTLGVPIPWAVDGRSALAGRSRDRLQLGTERGLITTPIAQVLTRRDEALQRQIELFGSGADSPGIHGVGPHPELLGTSVDRLRVGGNATARVHLHAKLAALLRRLPADSELVPTPLIGSITGDEAAGGRALAVAVNGRVVAVSRTYERGGETFFSAQIPESALRSGANEVAVFWVSGSSGAVSLRRLGMS